MYIPCYIFKTYPFDVNVMLLLFLNKSLILLKATDAHLCMSIIRFWYKSEVDYANRNTKMNALIKK